jgi:hypothetical protein
VVQLIEVVEEPEKIVRGVREEAAKSFNREDAKFVVRKSSRREAIVSAIGHLHMEQPEQADHPAKGVAADGL